MEALEAVALEHAVAPPTPSGHVIEAIILDEDAPWPSEEGPQEISGFACLINYVDASGAVTERGISCRRYELHGQRRMIGAICLKSHRYKSFACDRIIEVCDALTGESLGDGSYFDRFAVGAIRAHADTWNTTSQRKSLIVAGLNVLAFMARCDGHWHPLEGEIVEAFVCSLWIRKEWENDPPLDLIVSHANRLAPDGAVFEKSIRQFAHSRTSRDVLCHHVHRLIAADGIICDAEHDWASRFDEFMREAVNDDAAGSMPL